MQTIHEEKIVSPAGLSSSFKPTPVSLHVSKRLKIREFTSWAVCFAIVAGLTGLMKILNVGVTVETITSSLFYGSLAGLVFFVLRIITVSKTPDDMNSRQAHELN